MLLWLAGFFLIAVVGTWLARMYALRRNLLDHPGERRSHSSATPRGGGIAIVAALLLAGLVLLTRQPQDAALLSAFVVGLGLVAAIGWIDDHRPLSPWLRLGVHAVAAGLVAAAVWASSTNAVLVGAAFAIVLILTNVWNFMDGINGLAGSQAVLVAAALAWLGGGEWVWLAGALLAACLGFVPFNFPRARIFLGDVGSGAIGFTLAVLVVAAMAHRPDSWPVVWLAPAAFLVDAGLTLAARILRGERWWTAHTGHAYQRWARRAGSHVPVTLAYSAFTVLGIGLLAWLRWRPFGFVMIFVVAWYTSGALLWWGLQKRRQPV